MASPGWFRIYRALFDHPALQDDHASRVHAFCDLIGLAAYEPTRRRVGGTMVTLGRGEVLASVRFLSNRWGWSKSKVQRFLDALERESMLSARRSETGTPRGTQVGMVYLIVNYAQYQGDGDGERDTLRDSGGTPAGHSRDKDKKLRNPPTPPRGREKDMNAMQARVEMWSDFDCHPSVERLGWSEQSIFLARTRGIIVGESVTAWQTRTGAPVPWEDRPPLFRMALDERKAGQSLHTVLRQVIIPRETDPFPQRQSNAPQPGSEAAAVSADRRRETPGAGRSPRAPETMQSAPPLPSVHDLEAKREAAAARMREWSDRVRARLAGEPESVREELVREAREAMGEIALRMLPEGARERTIEAKALELYGRRIGQPQPVAA